MHKVTMQIYNCPMHSQVVIVQSIYAMSRALPHHIIMWLAFTMNTSPISNNCKTELCGGNSTPWYNVITELEAIPSKHAWYTSSYYYHVVNNKQNTHKIALVRESTKKYRNKRCMHAWGGEPYWAVCQSVTPRSFLFDVSFCMGRFSGDSSPKKLLCFAN